MGTVYLPVYLALARAFEARNPYTFEHWVQVADVAVRFGDIWAWGRDAGGDPAVARVAALADANGKEDLRALQNTQNLVTIIPWPGSFSFQPEQPSRLVICQRK